MVLVLSILSVGFVQGQFQNVCNKRGWSKNMKYNLYMKRWNDVGLHFWPQWYTIVLILRDTTPLVSLYFYLKYLLKGIGKLKYVFAF